MRFRTHPLSRHDADDLRSWLLEDCYKDLPTTKGPALPKAARYFGWWCLGAVVVLLIAL